MEKSLSNKTLEQLEKNIWQSSANESYLIQTCNALRKKPIGQFEIEDFRILIGQNIGLPFLIPIVIQILDKDFLAEGHFYPGDLLKSVLTSDPSFWKTNPKLWQKMVALYHSNLEILNQHDIIDCHIKKEIKSAFLFFAAYHT
jgi:CDI immunity proteins